MQQETYSKIGLYFFIATNKPFTTINLPHAIFIRVTAFKLPSFYPEDKQQCFAIQDRVVCEKVYFPTYQAISFLRNYILAVPLVSIIKLVPI